MKNFRQLSAAELLENSRRADAPFFGRAADGVFAQSQGFHIYSDLRVNLTLSAAEDDADAARFLRLLESYAAVLDECARAFGAQILEIQGERGHVFLDAAEVSPAALGKLFGFSIAVTHAIYDRIMPAAGDHWSGFSMAADFGPAVMIGSDCGGGSLISLGNAANAPAKRLGRRPRVESGHLAIRRGIYGYVADFQGNSEWLEVNVLEPSGSIAVFSNEQVNARAVTLAAAVLAKRRQDSRILLASSTSFQDPSSATVSDPIRVQGHCLRADLDGFSRQVDAASKAGPDAVMRLVQRFHQIMSYTRQFLESLGRPALELPWAGDCATLVLLPRSGENYSDTSTYLPVSASLKWHQQERSINEENVAWNTLMQSAKWAVGIGGGAVDEGNNGVMLVANVAAGGRAFRVLAGWGARRSNDGYQADGVRADDTVLHRVDYQQLDRAYKDAFQELDSRFLRAPLGQLRQCVAAKTSSLGAASVVTVPSIARPIPPPRPHGSNW